VRLEEIRDHWESAGASFPESELVTPTSRDPYLAQLERRAIISHLAGRESAMDVGCGDASHSIEYAKVVGRLIGVDNAASLLAVARRRIDAAGTDNVELLLASVLELDARVPAGAFDAVISQRCLINLPTWEDQKAALEQLHKVLASGGILLVSEGFIDELVALNQLRTALRLSPISVSRYNHFLSRDEFETFVGPLFRIRAIVHYGVYLYLSRVLHPLVVAPAEPRHDSAFNELAMRVALAGDAGDFARYSYNSLYALEKQ
jgi:SAM-dependent methyltransferase